ncbi:MAG TPA: helix-turn-helix domain-containing protein [Candidatus Paceibacterota bacterium]
MDTFELLTKTGLSKKEAAVYTALLEHGTLSLSDISRETHINRPALYQLLPKMKKDGLVSAVQKQRRLFYRAESPDRLLEMYKDEHKEIAKRLTELSEAHRYASPDKPLIKYFEGRHGVKFVFDDIAHTLPSDSTFYRYSARAGGKTADFENTYYARVRDTKRIERLVITSEEKASQKPKKLERSVKAIPKEFDLFEDNISLVIYGNKTAYIDYSSNTAFIVESEKIARFQEKLFKLLYKKL